MDVECASGFRNHDAPAEWARRGAGDVESHDVRVPTGDRAKSSSTPVDDSPPTRSGEDGLVGDDRGDPERTEAVGGPAAVGLCGVTHRVYRAGLAEHPPLGQQGDMRDPPPCVAGGHPLGGGRSHFPAHFEVCDG